MTINWTPSVAPCSQPLTPQHAVFELIRQSLGGEYLRMIEAGEIIGQEAILAMAADTFAMLSGIAAVAQVRT